MTEDSKSQSDIGQQIQLTNSSHSDYANFGVLGIATEISDLNLGKLDQESSGEQHLARGSISEAVDCTPPSCVICIQLVPVSKDTHKIFEVVDDMLLLQRYKLLHNPYDPSTIEFCARKVILIPVNFKKPRWAVIQYSRKRMHLYV